MNYFSVYLTLASSTFDPLVAFYQNLLGQPPSPLWPACYAEFRLPGLRLGIFKPRIDQNPEFQSATSGAMSLGLEVPDLEVAIAHLTHLGYPPPGPILIDSHGREVYAYDPDGNRLILHQAPAGTAEEKPE
ncbi:MAG: glyoxalase [Leptolyngbyaceae cyanobacterium SM2_3_12]|nr:glyoxalase [Leptolyngbyaceae cyanobacterium SM2_3_12]